MVGSAGMVHPEHPAPYARCDRCGYTGLCTCECCPQCGAELRHVECIRTALLSRQPHLPVLQQRGSTHFEAHARVLLQFIPSGMCFWLAVSQPVILGRGLQSGGDMLLDLSGLNAYDHGVSRQHCLLRRRESHLVVLDLGSSNGTYLNHERLFSHGEAIAANGDHLTLGTLHGVIFFNTALFD
jgi:hypothetical protein